MISPRHGDESLMDMDMSGMSPEASMSGHSSSTGHMSVFQNEMATALYTDAWTPTTVGAYVGTIFFIIVLAVVFRCLFAAKALAEARWLDAEMKRRFVVVQGKLPVSEQVSRDDLSKRMTLTENGVEEDVMVVQKRHMMTRPWRLSVDPLRALLDTVIVGVGYLLMLAVMTMNVGYFLAALGGTFIGSLLVGRFYSTGDH